MIKLIFMLIILMLLLPINTQAADKWTKQDFTIQGVYYLLKWIDWRQTRYIAKNPRYWHEVNPILGKHPSVSTVDKYFLITTVLHTAITHYLPKKYRIWWQGITIAGSGAFVGWNFSVGIKMDL